MWRLLVLSSLLASLLLAGCSSERVAGWYITRKIDGYFELHAEQKQQLRAQVDETILLVRREELPHWINLLREVRQGFHDGMSDALLEKLQRQYDQRLDAGVHIVIPRAAPLLVQLDGKQLDHFVARVNEDLAKQYDELQLPPEQRRAKLEDKALEVVEDFVGSLSDEQEASVRALIRKLPNERDRQLRSSKDNLAHFRAFMATHPTAPALQSELYAMWERRYDGLGSGHDKQARRAFQRQWLRAVFEVLDAKQRAHAEEELSDRIRMLKRYAIPRQD